MKPERDTNFRNLIAKTVKATGQPISVVENVIEDYFKIMAQAIQWDRPVKIHIDYIGDLVYNQKWRDKVTKKINDSRNKV